MNNLKFAFRNLAAHPCFAAAVIITLALGIGANTTVFTLVNAVLFKPPSIPGGDRLVIVNNQNLSQGPNTFSVSYPDFRDFQTEASSFEGLEASGGKFMVISEATNPPERVSTGHISAGMFGLFKTPPILGRTFSGEDDQPGKWMTVIGMSADIDQSPSQPTAPPLLYLPHRQEPAGYMYLMLRTSVAPATSAGPVRKVIQSIDHELPVFELATFPAAFARSNWNVRVFGVLFGTFAAIGLLMASVGIYGVVAQATARRTHEFGIRMALGSTSMELVRLVISKGLRQLILSVILGIALAYGTSNIMEKTGLLFQISARDPHVFLMVPTLLAIIGLLACWLPARRVANVSPMEALRVD